MASYVLRLVDELLSEYQSAFPAILLTGPRATGKTTTAERRAESVVRLDREAEAEAFRADPDAALEGLPEPILLDEWQAVPAVLGAVKRAVDRDPRPNRFLLTGSVRADLEGETWPGTGRLVRLPVYGMTVREQRLRSDGPSFIDRLVENEPLSVPTDPPDLRGYVRLALTSGFPQAALSIEDDGLRQRWLESYVDQLLTRDVGQLAGRRDPARVRRYFEAYALNSAGTVAEQTLLEAAGIDKRTATAYEQLLRNLLVVDPVPAWRTNRLKRLVTSPKRYLVDAALVTAALRLDVDTVLRDGNLLGRVLDTFVAAQLRAEAVASPSRPVMYHLRTEQGRQEVDVVLELPGGGIIGIEVKASAAPKPDDAKHLLWLADRLGDDFVAGVVFHTGPRVFALADGIVAAPICALWG